MSDQKVLVVTRTGEHFQPARIYYQVNNLKGTLAALKKLRCMLPVNRQHWQWTYEQEASKLRFQISRNKIAKEFRPLVLGDFFFRDNNELILDVRSPDRAMHALSFFRNRMGLRVATPTHLRLVNRYFNQEEAKEEYVHPPFNYFFDRDDIAVPKAAKFEEAFAQISEQYESAEEREEALMQFLEQDLGKASPEVEDIPLYPNDKGDNTRLSMMLVMRKMEALMRWQGNKTVTQGDILQLFTEKMMQSLGEEEGEDLTQEDEDS